MTSYRRWIRCSDNIVRLQGYGFSNYSGTLSLRYTVIKQVASTKKLFLSWSSPWSVINEFFSLKQKCLVFKISRFFCFGDISRFQNLSRHHGHCYIMEVTLVFFLLNPKYENEIWWNTSVLNCYIEKDMELSPSPPNCSTDS